MKRRNDFDIVKALWLRREKRRRKWKLKEIEGTPPLIFKAKSGTLENYRIYGNTVSGESVGDRTGNLFDGMFEQGTVYESTAINNSYYVVKHADTTIYGKPVGNRIRTSNLINTNGKCVVSWNENKYDIYYVLFDSNQQYMGIHSSNDWQRVSPITITQPYIGIAIRYKNNTVMEPGSATDLNLMINAGSEPLPYEPYGYRVPVTVTNGTDTQTTNLYLPEQIKMVGNEAEYVDYEEQKQHFADGTSVDVALPALPTLSGTNVLSVGTNVQPSKVMVKGKVRT